MKLSIKIKNNIIVDSKFKMVIENVNPKFKDLAERTGTSLINQHGSVVVSNYNSFQRNVKNSKFSSTSFLEFIYTVIIVNPKTAIMIGAIHANKLKPSVFGRSRTFSPYLSV